MIFRVLFALLCVKPAMSLSAAPWLRWGLLGPNVYGIPVVAPWGLSGLLMWYSLRHLRGGTEAGRLLAVFWILVSSAFASRALREVELEWWPDPEWLLWGYVPLLFVLKLPQMLLRDASASCRRVGRHLVLAIGAAAVVFSVGGLRGWSGWLEVAAIVVYCGPLLAAGSSAKLLGVSAGKVA